MATKKKSRKRKPAAKKAKARKVCVSVPAGKKIKLVNRKKPARRKKAARRK